jgi:hypothetical protein
MVMTMFAEPQQAGMATLHDRVMARPRIAAYLSSRRRLAFNERGIFRHYPELEEEEMQKDEEHKKLDWTCRGSPRGCRLPACWTNRRELLNSGQTYI